jgi:hypothetical protein
MKLMNSLTEERFRTELVRSNQSLITNQLPLLCCALQSENLDSQHTYVLDELPEQASSIYTLLTAPRKVTIMELWRDGTYEVLSRESAEHYGKRCSNRQKLKLAIARDLVDLSRVKK